MFISFSGPSVSPLAVNTIERQLQSQKKLVKEQQKQLKEQRRMIEQLQIDQRRQELRDQLKDKQHIYSSRRPDNKEQINSSLETTEKKQVRNPLKKRRNSVSEPDSSSSSPVRLVFDYTLLVISFIS